MEISILPIGSIEAHGPHLPLETDTIIAEELSKRIKEKLKIAVVLPSIKKSPIRATRDSLGSVNESPEDFMNAVFASARKCRTKKLFILSGHWGNQLRASLTLAGNRIQEELGIDVYIFDYPKAVPPEILESENPEIEHAGEAETSEMLALCPKSVKEVYKKLKPNYLTTKPKYIFQAFTKNDLKTLQYWGEPAKASAEKGKIIIGRVVDVLSKAVMDVK
jgi:creatinine amidohydrolase